MKKNTTVYALVFVVLILVIGVMVYISYLKFGRTTTSVTQTTAPQNTSTQNVTPVNARFEAKSLSWKIGSAQSVPIIFEGMPNPIPAAFHLKITYDPNAVSVKSISQGNLWSSSNVLENKIDNKNGYVIYTLGQGFDAKTTSSNLIATINFTILDSQFVETTITLDNESVVARVGENNLVPIAASPLIGTITR